MKNNVVRFSMRFVVLLMTFSMIPLMAIAKEVGYRAMVMDIKGKAFVLHSGAKKSLDLGYLLYPGDSVEITKDASMTITYLESGQEERWSGGAKFVVEKNGSKPAPAHIMKKNRIILPQIVSPQQGSLKLRGLKVKVEVGSLSNTRTIEERPVFRWSPNQSVQKYRVRFYSLSENEPIWQRTTKDAELSFPSDVPPLNPGSGYAWVIEAFEDGYVTAQNRSCFSLPPNDELVEIKKGVNDYRTRLEANSTDTAVRLRLIFFLEEHQLYDDALEQYSILQKQHGESESLTNRQEKIIKLRRLTCPAY